MRKSRVWITAVVVVGVLIWWFYPRVPLPLGYTGTAPNPNDLPGERPVVDMRIGSHHLKKVQLALDGQPVDKTVLRLERGKEVDVKGQLVFEVGMNDSFYCAQISIASKSKNAQGFLIEGEQLLHGGLSFDSAHPLIIDIAQKWTVPDHAGEFFLLVVYHVSEPGPIKDSRRFAIVCPVVIQ